MGYNWAKTKMKKLLLFALLIMAGSVVVGNATNQQKSQSKTMEIVKTGDEVKWWYEDEKDDGIIIGRAVVVRNYLSHPITWYGKIIEDGEEDTISVYVPANEKRRAWYGNGTLRVIDAWYKDSY